MSDGVDPSSAVASVDLGGSSRDQGSTVDGADARDQADDAVDAATESHRAAEGAESSSSLSSRNGLKNALLRTSPDTPLEQVESPWDPERGGMNRVYRGLQKMLDFEGMPAVVDIVVGLGEFVVRFEPEGGDQEAGADQDGVDDELPDGLGGELS